MNDEAMPYRKPLPEPGPASQPFWAGLREHKLKLQRSKKTGKVIYYPRLVSPYGPKDELEWVECSGRAPSTRSRLPGARLRRNGTMTVTTLSRSWSSMKGRG
ncbi:MAG: hypothetical protein IPN07_09925 [Dehalococcoidia bacterium]|nr:hypothetical protein [Dehalococcoidia bacterium]